MEGELSIALCLVAPGMALLYRIQLKVNSGVLFAKYVQGTGFEPRDWGREWSKDSQIDILLYSEMKMDPYC